MRSRPLTLPALLVALALAPSWADTRGARPQDQDTAPALLDDGIAVGTPSSQGMDVGRLEALHRRIEAGEHGEIHSVLVLRNGTLVFERYYGTSHINDIHTLQSVTKSITALLVGIAIQDGSIKGVDTPVADFFPEYADVFEADPRKRRITLHHLLTMSHGLEWDELSIPYGNPDNVVWQMAQSEDWMRFVLSRPVATDPGQRFRYSSGSSLLLSGILQNATGMQAHAFAERRLFDPLGIPVYAWFHHLEHPKRWSHTGGGLLMRSRDLLKLGMLIIDRGAWRGEQIVPAAWIDALSEPYLSINDDMDYGYQWYLRPLRPGSEQRDGVVHGWGWGGQFVFAAPKLSLVAVFTSGNFADKDLERAPIRFLYDDVIAAVVPDG
jgi:CubicO group peptidase (beta-lactamase class C family)